MSIEVPPEVAVDEIRVGGRVRDPKARVGKVRRPSSPPTSTTASTTTRNTSSSATSPQSAPTIDDVADLLDDNSPSSVVRIALDEMLLDVIAQVKHDLATGNPKVRQQLAKTFLPSIMNMASKETKDTDTELDDLRAQMNDLHQQMFDAPPAQYEPASTHVPDEDELPEGGLPSIDPETGDVT